MRDECRQPRTKNCTSFKKLNETCDIISSCAWSGGRGRTQKLTNQTAEAFVLSTRANIEAAELLLTQHNFIYVLPGVFADEALEKFFGQARQRSGGNFYIDIVDIKAAAKTKNLHALLKYELTPCESHDVPCTSNICIDDDQFDINIADTEDLVQSISVMERRLNIADIRLKIHSWSEDYEEVDDDCSVVSEVSDLEPNEEEVDNATDDSEEKVSDSESSGNEDENNQLSSSTSQSMDNSSFKGKN
ncbi:unnamed protein product [Clavelina lepadiformis]|uniref:Uncharacterized protein n=1 Tax=Clavelina lepadiformis TaxID=159417 RepID=A0ABP0GTU6_CLALP